MVIKFSEMFAIIMQKKLRKFCRHGLTNLDATPTFQKSSKYIWDALYDEMYQERLYNIKFRFFTSSEGTIPILRIVRQFWWCYAIERHGCACVQKNNVMILNSRTPKVFMVCTEHIKRARCKLPDSALPVQCRAVGSFEIPGERGQVV